MTDQHPPPPPPPPGASSGPPQPPDPYPGRPVTADPPFSENVDRRSGRPDTAFRVPFSVGDALVALGIYFIGQLVVGLGAAVVIALLGADPGAGNTPLLVMTVVSQVVGLLLALGFLALRRRLNWRVLGPVRPGVVPLLLGLAVGFVGTILSYAINAALTLLIEPQEPVEQQLLEDVLAGGTTTLVVILAAVVMAPIAEELLFRGLLFQALRRRLGLWPGALLSAAAFCVVHVEIVVSQPLALVGLFVLAVVLAWSFHRTGSIVVPIVGHATFNAISLGLALVAENLPIAGVGAGGWPGI